MATPTPYIVENDQGDRKAWNGRAWVDLPRKDAPGAPYLAETPAAPDKSEAAYFRQFREKNDTSTAAARTGIARARRAEGLLERQKTGGIYAVPVLGSAVGMFDPEIRELDAIQSEVARSKRVPGEGAISDFDARQFLAMTYGKDKPTETNKALIQAQRVADDAALQRRQFMEWHFNTFGQASGAEEAWDRYSQDNPIFDPETEAKGHPILNPQRENWRQYFGVTRGEGDERPTQAQADVARSAEKPPTSGKVKPPGWTQDLPKRQLQAAKMFAGTKAPAGDRGNPFVPTSPDEFKAIRPGAWVLDDDGTVFKKGAR